MRGNHDFYIYDEDGDYYVRPPLVIVPGGPNQKVRFRNLTKDPVTAIFPPEVVAVKRVDAGPEASGEGDIQEAAKGIYEFAVEVTPPRGPKKLALGNSWPKIIVDP